MRPVCVFAKPPEGQAQILALLRGRYRVATRLIMIWFSLQGWPSTQIATVLGYHPATVRRWIGRYNTCGIAGLADRPRPGAPRLGSPHLGQRIRRGPGGSRLPRPGLLVHRRRPGPHLPRPRGGDRPGDGAGRPAPGRVPHPRRPPATQRLGVRHVGPGVARYASCPTARLLGAHPADQPGSRGSGARRVPPALDRRVPREGDSPLHGRGSVRVPVRLRRRVVARDPRHPPGPSRRADRRAAACGEHAAPGTPPRPSTSTPRTRSSDGAAALSRAVRITAVFRRRRGRRAASRRRAPPVP